MVMKLLPFLLRGTFSLIAVFLGSEGIAIMTKPLSLALFGLFLMGLIGHFRVICSRRNAKSKKGFVLAIQILLCLVIYIYISFMRLHLASFLSVTSLSALIVSRVGLHFSDLFSFFMWSVGGGNALPLPAPSAPSSSSSWTEDSFEMGVLLEPFSETEEGPSVNSSTPGTPSSRDWEELRRVLGEEPQPVNAAAQNNQHLPRAPDQEGRAVLDTSIQGQIQAVESALKRSFEGYCQWPSVAQRFPLLDFQNLDYSDLAKDLAQQLDLDYKSTEELLDLLTFVQKKHNMRSLFDQLLNSLMKK